MRAFDNHRQLLMTICPSLNILPRSFPRLKPLASGEKGISVLNSDNNEAFHEQIMGQFFKNGAFDKIRTCGKVMYAEINNSMRSIDKSKAVEMNFKRWGNLSDRYDWKRLQQIHDSGVTISKLRKNHGISFHALNKGIENGLLIVNKDVKTVVKHSEESKKKMSEKRKQWLRDNPDKHPWRNKDKFKSEPCEKAKEFLRKLNIRFIEEYQPEIEGRSFSIDIAMPEKMIALEINGNQHYGRDGRLKPYYQERHDLLESNGWIVYEIHYSACFDLDKWSDFVDKIRNTEKKIDFDYFYYVPIPKNRKKKHCIDCGKNINSHSIRCRECNYKISRNRKVDRPSKEELEKMIWELPMTKLGKKYRVSDNAVRKWCKSYNINNLPPRGYFIKKMVQSEGLEPFDILPTV